ncbi:MAG: SurA N-terminal domain-containing protein [Wolbachia endosymbiont of Meromenopon meropis]|nr:SurA N-terminal domain-containing protein [Wolbachia endosymbiont of Meromenopon meropis]
MQKILILILVILPIKLLSIEIEIIADVNNEPISNLDIEKRINLINTLFHTQIQKEQKFQILKKLVDEVIIIDEAQRLNIKLSDKELNDAIVSFFAQNFEIKYDEISQYIKEHNIDLDTLKKQIKCELLWGKVVETRIIPFIKISNKEINDAKYQIEKPDYLITFQEFIVPMQKNENIFHTTKDFIKKIRDNNNDFIQNPLIKARKVTVSLNRLKGELKSALEGLEIGCVAGPIINLSEDGYYSIIKVIDRIQLDHVLLESTLKLKQIVMKSHEDSLDNFKRQKINCLNFDKMAQNFKLPNVKEFEIKMRDLTPNLQILFSKAKIDEIVEFRSDSTDNLIMLCDIKNNILNTEIIRHQIYQQKILMQSNLLLNDIRKNTAISYQYSNQKWYS